MLPTLNGRGDVVLLEHVSVWARTLRAGDVVVARSVQNPRQVVCKRVLGLAGQTLMVPSPTGMGAMRMVVVSQPLVDW